MTPATRVVMESIEPDFIKMLAAEGVRVVMWKPGEPVVLPRGNFSYIVLGPVALASNELVSAVERAFPDMPLRGFVFSPAFGEGFLNSRIDVAVADASSAFSELALWLRDKDFSTVVLISGRQDLGLSSALSDFDNVKRFVIDEESGFDSIKPALPLPSSDSSIAVVCFFPDFLDELVDFYAGRDGVAIVAVGTGDFSFLVRASLLIDVKSVVDFVTGLVPAPVWRFVNG